MRPGRIGSATSPTCLWHRSARSRGHIGVLPLGGLDGATGTMSPIGAPGGTPHGTPDGIIGSSRRYRLTTLLWVSPASPACRAKRLMQENSSTTAPSGGPFSRTPHRRRALRGGWGDWTTPPGKLGRKACFSIAVLRHLWRSLAQSGGRILIPRLLLLLFLTLGLTGGPMGGIIGIIMAPIG